MRYLIRQLEPEKLPTTKLGKWFAGERTTLAVANKFFDVPIFLATLCLMGRVAHYSGVIDSRISFYSEHPGAKELLDERSKKTCDERAMKLRIQLVPKPLFERTLREALGKARWDQLRHKLIETNGAHCEICGSTERLHGHEVWMYREKNGSATAVLLKVQIICIDCHDIRHFARTAKLFQVGIITLGRYGVLRKRFRRVNGCRQREFDDHFHRSLRKWARRSTKRRTIDWGKFREQVKVAKAARVKWAQARA